MSEYQYYEFRAIDQPLTRQQQEELRSLSSRAEITATRFQNEYNYGDFRGSTEELMKRYFDAFLYLANWGTRQLIFRLPKETLDRKTAEQYCHHENASVTATRDHVVISLHLEQEEADDWLEGEGLIDELLPLRDALAEGDLRLLYLAWLSGIRQADDYDEDPEDELEPPVPAGLNQLDDSLRAVIDFLEMDEDLIAVAAEASPPLQEQKPGSDDLGAWVTTLPAGEKDKLLTMLARGQAARAEALLKRRFRETQPKQPVAAPSRTAFQLLEAADEHIIARQKAEKQRAAAEYQQRLNDLAASEDTMWQQVDDLIATKKVAAYDRAIDLLRQLRELAEHENETALFANRVAHIRACYRTLYGLHSRLDNAKMPK